MQDFLVKIIIKSRNEGGCGMSTRPEYYSGRGARSGDLSARELKLILEEIRKHKGVRAGQRFKWMVRDLPVLSATDFLLALHALDANNFVWRKRKHLPKANGKYFTDMGSAMGTFLESYGGRSHFDETPIIRSEFFGERLDTYRTFSRSNSWCGVGDG